MDENLLLIAFVVFAILIFVIALVFRKMTVDDIFSDNKPSSISDMPFSSNSSRTKDAFPAVSPKSTLSQTSAPQSGIDKPGFELNRQTINKLGKILGVIGTVMIIAPLPSSLDGISFGVAFVGYLLARFTNTPKQQKTGTEKSSAVDTLRKLAGKQEYREAMQMLASDMANKNLATDAEKRQRAINYLQSKGIPAEEANRNVILLASYISQQKKK